MLSAGHWGFCVRFQPGPRWMQQQSLEGRLLYVLLSVSERNWHTGSETIGTGRAREGAGPQRLLAPRGQICIKINGPFRDDYSHVY